MSKDLHISHGTKDFDKAQFGKRFREKRKSAGFRSQESFAEKYDELYNTDGQKSILNSVKKYEGGKSAPNPETLLRICKVLGNCDAGFLLGLYDESKKGIHDIAALTGLSEPALQNLISVGKDYPGLSSQVISSAHFDDLIRTFWDLWEIAGLVDYMTEELNAGSARAETEDHIDDLIRSLKYERYAFAEICVKILNEIIDVDKTISEAEKANSTYCSSMNRLEMLTEEE